MRVKWLGFVPEILHVSHSMQPPKLTDWRRIFLLLLLLLKGMLWSWKGAGNVVAQDWYESCQ